ncbi:hypothetical protein EDD22DRAFT_32068 [Suillus occidentalis]|nr:hypothetical protein EDD22DRAFT_32068 [Suillus occidentalis]
MIGLHSVVSVAVIGTSYGIFSGGVVATMGPLISYLTPEISHIGARMGIMFAIAAPAKVHPQNRIFEGKISQNLCPDLAFLRRDRAKAYPAFAFSTAFRAGL